MGTIGVSALGRRFLIVWAGQCLSTIGSTLSGVGVAVYVYLETGDATWLGVLAAVSALPFLVVTARSRRASERSSEPATAVARRWWSGVSDS